jgi:hypothetical protein
MAAGGAIGDHAGRGLKGRWPRAYKRVMRVIFRCDPALVDLIPKPVPARLAMPDWLRSMPRHAFSDVHGEDVRTVKQCPPFIDAMSQGFVIPLPCDVMVDAGRLSWNWDTPTLAAGHHPRAPLSFHAPAQVEGTPFADPGQVIVKFNTFWTIELEPGWSLFATHPVNRADLPFRLISGLVDADRFHDVGILFPAVWLDAGFSGKLPRGMPVAQCIPIPRQPMTCEYAAFDPEETRRYDETAARLLTGPGVYRRTFRAPRLAGGEGEAEVGGAEP